MSLQGTLNTAVQGMNTEAHALSVLSTNIANVATTGYKTERTDFETILNHISPNGSKFLSVRPVDTRMVSKQGQISTTQGTYDLALNGRGFMITNTIQDGTGIWQYTRDGSLQGKAIELATTTNGTTQYDQGTLLTTTGGAYVMGWPANADGTFTETPSLSSLQPIMFQTNSTLPSKQTDNIQLQANVSSGNATTGNRQTVTVPFIDSEGNSRTITMGMTQTLDAGWDLDFTASQDALVSSDIYNATFDSQAKLNSPQDGLITLTVQDPNGPQTIALDLSGMTDYAGQGTLTVQNVHQDGYIEGRLNNTYFNSEGVLLGSYTNGELKNLYKLPVATFAAENKLQAMPGNYFVQTDESGSLFVRGLDIGGTSTGGTAFVAGALERSTVDLADQFSRMIITQRAYSSNAQVLRTADEMTMAARDLKR